jgi:hypothetical protein
LDGPHPTEEFTDASEREERWKPRDARPFIKITGYEQGQEKRITVSNHPSEETLKKQLTITWNQP